MSDIPLLPKQKILVVDDQADITELLAYALSKEDYQVQTANGGKAALAIAESFMPDLILLDIMMPDMDGIQVCEKLRQINALSDCWIVFLTAREEEYAEVAAFDAGANDYVIKPIKMRALLRRIQAFFVNQPTSKKNSVKDQFRIADLLINQSGYYVFYDGKQIDFPKKEFELLCFLAKNPNRVFARDQLLSSIWGEDINVNPRTVDVHIRRIREKMDNHHIRTVNGGGYMFLTKNGKQ